MGKEAGRNAGRGSFRDEEFEFDTVRDRWVLQEVFY